ncbi:MAG: hypothetical protein UT11_C0030G0008 [Berkelbacteria bacterium GW2011_GWA2_38_9]|uniref:Nudix hydrolase domain-containing protein n=1 Tax=Berkelbacteria bacterium GW2011_GWA2_38_9 TaxID=1618334 RepID=A0A0G0LB63_9BACT|nr:MAG: hypothetical protein UT11_C0030G0008 [Berkelbacteria bacterium GW2011_GWA2_38_9]
MSEYNFCSKCGAQLKKNKTDPYCPICKIVYYHNSKPCCGVLIIRDDELLLGIRKINPFKGQLDVIGGFLLEGEHPEDGCRREALEETGLKIKIKEYLGTYMDEYGDCGIWVLSMYCIAEIESGKMKANDDVESLQWRKISELNPEELAFKCNREAIQALKKRYQITK